MKHLGTMSGGDILSRTSVGLKLIFFIVINFWSHLASSQEFEKIAEMWLPDSITAAKAEWVDIDNDGLLDIMVVGDVGAHSYLYFVKGDTINPPAFWNVATTIIPARAYLLLDYNSDNRMDLLVSGKDESEVKVYINQGGFAFADQTVTLPSFDICRFVDMDNDAQMDLVLSGEIGGSYYTGVFKRTAPYTWTETDILYEIHAKSIELADIDYNGYFDIFVSGRVSVDSIITAVLVNRTDTSYMVMSPKEWIGVTAAGDLNADGIFDVVFSGVDLNGNLVNKVYVSEAESYRIVDSVYTLQNRHLFAADMNSDGKLEISFIGKDATGDTLNVIHSSSYQYDTLSSRDLAWQRFGDLDHDGDLDLLQIIESKSTLLKISRNETGFNRPPSPPDLGIGIPVFNRKFLYWNPAVDDHTPSVSLTYDLSLLETNSDYSGEFDLQNTKRLTVTHGNLQTFNFKLLKNLPTDYEFVVEAVDNSFHAGEQLCEGGSIPPGNVEVCIDIVSEEISACKFQQLHLTAEANALWFSFREGHLGEFTTLSFDVTKADTLFYFIPYYQECVKLHTYVLHLTNEPIVEYDSMYECLGNEIKLGVEPGWTEVNWYDRDMNDLGSGDSILFTVNAPDTVHIELKPEYGCTTIRHRVIRISEPSVEVENETFKILKGESVQILASGADSYVWSPSIWLDNPEIADPLAAPEQTITYTVTGYDSLGCSATAVVKIIVDNTAFIANLFTPNQDSKNDFIKIYGLSEADNFSFSIYNREGKLVYSTNSISEATGEGWDGTINGSQQPPGVYVWKVSGSYPSGRQLLLNGKTEGSILLVR